MADLVYSADTLVPGTANNVNQVKAIKTETAAYVNGSGWVDSTRLASGAVTGAKLASTAVGDSTEGAALGLNGSSTVRRGKSIIATEESTTSTSFTQLTTPDRVQSVVLPTDGLIFVLYRAFWKMTGASSPTGQIDIFLNSSQITSSYPDTPSAVTLPTTLPAGGTQYSPVATTSGNGTNGAFCTLAAPTNDASAVISNYHTMGAGLGTPRWSPIVLEASAGTYDVSVRVKVASGTSTPAVYLKNRKLWVWTQGF